MKGLDSSHRKLYLIILLSLLILSAGCGKHNAKAKPPQTQPKRPPVSTAKPSTQTPVKQPPSKEVPPTVVITPESPDKEKPGALGPSIRIGLDTSAKEILITSTAEFYVAEKKPEASAQLVKGEIQIRVERAAGSETAIFRVQVASYTKMETASDLKKKIAENFDEPILIHENPNGRKQVRVGEFSENEEARKLQKKLAKAGYSDAFIVKETIEADDGELTLALRGPENLFLINAAGFIISPSTATDFLKHNGKPYRGILDVSMNKNSKITVVNQLGMEEYLPGVVPAEMSPTTYPESDALAALSIAARTYALKNMGSMRAEGYDLTNDERFQVYRGVSAEHKMTTEAVRQTSGIVIYYDGKLIDAMYMSTCGGRTEDFSNVFDGPPVPYLKSVFCSIESGGTFAKTIQGRHDLEDILLADDGAVANRNIELARVLGIINENSHMTPEYLSKQIDRDEATAWIEAAGKAARKKPPVNALSAKDLAARSGFLRNAAEYFFGADAIKRKVSSGDVNYYLGNLKDGDDVPSSAREALTYLMLEGLWKPYPDNTIRPSEPIRRADAISLLLRWVESSRPEVLVKGTMMVSDPSRNDEDEDGSAIMIKSGTRTQAFKLAQMPRLFRMDSGRVTPVSSLKTIGNEKLRFHIDAQGKIDFLELELNPAGAASDRYSPVSSWDVSFTRKVMTEKLKPVAGNIGELKDIKPMQFGNSGRVTQIQLIGSKSSITIKGIRLRSALGLRDILFTITRDHNADGEVEKFNFHGHGYGHGVGLCQVGAFGMARAGRTYEEILKTYYQGVQIKKAY